MTVARTAEHVECLGTVSSGAPATVSFNPTSDAQLLVVTVGWSSASSFVPPVVSFDGEVLILNSTHAIDTAVGAIALYTLPLNSPANTAKNLVVAPTGFLGTTEISIAAYKGTSQSLGVVITNEYGTSSAGVNTGTTSFSGITAGSITTVSGITFFGTQPSSIVVTGLDWSLVDSATGTNGSIYLSENAIDSGLISCTYTDPTNFWCMLVLGYEVLAGTPPSPPGGVVTLATQTAVFGIINSANPGTMSFTPTADADFVVAIVAWASSDPFFAPKVTIDGHIMQFVPYPIEVSGVNGAVAVYALALPAPISSSVNVVVSCTPNFMGYSCATVYATKNSAKLLGKIFPDEYGVHDAGVLSGTTDMPGITSGSALFFMGATFFGNEPPSLLRSAGWNATGFDVEDNQSVFGFYAGSTAGGDESITLSDTTVFFNLLCLGVEVLAVGAVAPDSSVVVTASTQMDLGVIGGITVTEHFDFNNADYAIFSATRSNNVVSGPAAYTLAGMPIIFDTALSVVHEDTSTVMDIAFIANPPSGLLTITATGQSGYFGYTTLGLIGLKTMSGVVGVRTTLSASGTGANLALAPTQEGSRLIALVAAIFPSAEEVPSYGWTTLNFEGTSPAIDQWLFTAVGGAHANLFLTGAAFAALSVIVLEFQTLIETVPTVTGVGNVTQTHSAIAGTATNLGKLTPNNQEFHVYWETWEDIPFKDPTDLQPDDFFLARIPSYVTDVLISFAIPRFTYAGLSSMLKPTTGLNFPGTGADLKACLDLLRTRTPTIRVWVAMQQNTPEASHNEPYDPNGWYGQTSDNLAATKLFVEDMGMEGIIIDYECLSQNPAPENHCIRHSDGTVTCYTDADLTSTILRMRAALPRPIKLILDGIHVGAYGVGPYLNAPPNGVNSGYDVCVAIDPDCVAALDGIHAMTYDAGSDYDPRTAFAAYKTLFPTLPIFIGLRAGPPQYQNVKQTANDMMDYCNWVIMLGGLGSHIYSGMWDTIYIYNNLPHGADPTVDDGSPPFGNYSQAFPDGSIAAAVVTRIYNLGLEELPPGVGYTGINADLRMSNRFPAANFGLVGPIL